VRVLEALQSARPSISFEFFPPKNDAAAGELMETIDAMRELQPAFVSMTYGAGGSSRDRSLDLVRRIKHELALDVMAHLTCAGSSGEELHAFSRCAAIRRAMPPASCPPAAASRTLPS